MLITVALLQLADAGMTYFIIRRGLGYESNPVMAWLIARLGLVVGLALPKAGVVLVIYLAVLPSPYATQILGMLAALYAVVVLNNVGVIRRASR